VTAADNDAALGDGAARALGEQDVGLAGGRAGGELGLASGNVGERIVARGAAGHAGGGRRGDPAAAQRRYQQHDDQH